MESAITIVPFGKITAPGAVKIFEGREVLQKFEDPLFGSFRIYKTEGRRRPGFWENDPSKVQRLIDAFKSGHNIKNACIYAGISEAQWRHFNDVFLDFSRVKEACESVLSFAAIKSVGEGIAKRPELAYKYAEKRGDFNFETRKVDGEQPLQPTVVVPVQINNNFNDEKIKNDAGRVAAEFVSERTGEGKGGSAHRVENTVQS